MNLLILKLEWTDAYDVATLIIGFILGASLVISALGVIYFKAAKPFYIKWIKPVKDSEQNRVDVLAKITGNDDKLTKILAELRTNGGTSIKDALDRIECDLQTVGERQRFRDKFSGTALFEMGNAGQCTFVNNSLCEMLGYDSSSFIGKNWRLTLDESDRHRVSQSWAEAIRDKSPFDSEQTVIHGKSDERVKIYVRAVPYFHKNELSGYFGYIEKV